MNPPVRPAPGDHVTASVDVLLKAQSGDAEALEWLVARYLPALQRWASGRLPPGLNTTLDTGQLVQDAVVHALRSLNAVEIRTGGALQAYLRRAVNNRIVDLYNRAARQPPREEIREMPSVEATSPLEAAIGAEAIEWYEHGLAALRDEERQAIVLRVEFGLPYDEIAEQLGKPNADAARMTVTHAITRLVDQMRHAR